MYAGEHLHIVTDDVRDDKRWRKVYRLMKGYGEWLQLSVFQCRLSWRRRVELASRLDAIIEHDEDHVLLMDIGTADAEQLRVTSLGKTFEAVERKALIV